MQARVLVAPSLLLSNTYTISYDNEQVLVPESSCSATLCQYQTNFTSDNRPSNDFIVSVTVSNGIGNGQSVNTPFQGEFDIGHPSQNYLCMCLQFQLIFLRW